MAGFKDWLEKRRKRKALIDALAPEIARPKPIIAIISPTILMASHSLPTQCCSWLHERNSKWEARAK